MPIRLFTKILQGGEENAIKKLTYLINIAIEANMLLGKTISGEKCLDKIKELEKKADHESIQIEKDISSGSVAPSLIDNFMKLVDLEDGIIDSIYNLARKLSRFRLNDEQIRLELITKLKRMHEIGNKALLLLQRMHETDNLNEIIKIREDVEKLEEESDEIKDSLLDLAYSKNIDFKSFYFIVEVAHEADNFLDKCEDSADVYFTIISSIIS